MRAALAREMRVFPKTMKMAAATLWSPSPIGAALNAMASRTTGCADDALAASRLLAIHNVANDLRYQYSRGTLISYMRTAVLSRPAAAGVGRGAAPPPTASASTSTSVDKAPAQVAFTITRGTRKQLGALGFAEEDIRSLKPAEAIALVHNSINVDDSRQWLAAAAEAEETAEAAIHGEGTGNVAVPEEEEQTSAKFDMSTEIQKLRAKIKRDASRDDTSLFHSVAEEGSTSGKVMLQREAEGRGGQTTPPQSTGGELVLQPEAAGRGEPSRSISGNSTPVRRPV